MSSPTSAKRSGRASLRKLITGGGRKARDKGDGGSVASSVAEDDSSASSNSKMNGGVKQQVREMRSSEPNQGAEASRSRRASATQPRDVRPPAPPPLDPPTASSKESAENVARISAASTTTNESGKVAEVPTSRGRGAGNVLQRLRERSRSRSRARPLPDNAKELLVAVTSCRSDGYYSQKAPGSISKLPRKAPTNLKLFHELAVGVKDAYAAVGATPRNATDEEKKKLEKEELEAKLVLWEFVGNLDFVSDSRCSCKYIH